MRSPTKRSSERNEKFEVYFAARTRKTNADRRSNLMVVRREKVKSDAVIVQKERKESSLKRLEETIKQEAKR